MYNLKQGGKCRRLFMNLNKNYHRRLGQIHPQQVGQLYTIKSLSRDNRVDNYNEKQQFCSNQIIQETRQEKQPNQQLSLSLIIPLSPFEKTSKLSPIQCLQCLSAIFSVICIICSQLSTTPSPHSVSYKNLTFCFSLLTALSFCLHSLCQQHKLTCSQLSLLLLRLLLLPFFPNNFISGEIDPHSSSTTLQIPLDNFLCTLVSLRLFFICQFLLTASQYRGSRADRVANLYTVRMNFLRALKFKVQSSPRTACFGIAFLNILLLPYLLLKLEGQINPSLSQLLPCIYYTVVTATTSGYGDISPYSIYGRILSIGIIISGVCSTSLMLIFTANWLKLTPHQYEPHQLINNLQAKAEAKQNFIQLLENYYITSNRKYNDPEDKREAIRELRNKLRGSLNVQTEGTNSLNKDMYKYFKELMSEIEIVKNIILDNKKLVGINSLCKDEELLSQVTQVVQFVFKEHKYVRKVEKEVIMNQSITDGSSNNEEI